MLGGSASSLSVSSPRNFRKYDLPFVQKAAEICKRYGVYSHLHVCGRSRKVVEMVAEETDVDVMEPLEELPGGDVDITEIKRRYGKKLCLKGNINTFEFMLRATPEQVEELSKKLAAMRHDINNHLSLIVAAVELIKYNPEVATRMSTTLAEQPPKISDQIGRFSKEMDRILGISRD